LFCTKKFLFGSNYFFQIRLKKLMGHASLVFDILTGFEENKCLRFFSQNR